MEDSVCVAVAGEALRLGPRRAGRSCIAARSRSRAHMTLALNLAKSRRARGASRPPTRAPGGCDAPAAAPPPHRAVFLRARA